MRSLPPPDGAVKRWNEKDNLSDVCTWNVYRFKRREVWFSRRSAPRTTSRRSTPSSTDAWPAIQPDLSSRETSTSEPVIIFPSRESSLIYLLVSDSGRYRIGAHFRCLLIDHFRSQRGPSSRLPLTVSVLNQNFDNLFNWFQLSICNFWQMAPNSISAVELSSIFGAGHKKIKQMVSTTC